MFKIVNILFLIILNSSATTYYISVNGNDAWSGISPDSAWRHINHACSLVVAGDSVLVLPGFYDERVVLRHSGTPGNKIIFKSEPRREATLWGFDTNQPNQGSYVRIEGFNITWDTCLTSWRDFGIFISSDYVDIIDNHIYNFRKTAIQTRWSTPWIRGGYIAQNYIFHCQMGIVVCGHNFLIEDNEVEKLFHYRAGDCDYTRFFGDSITFRHNYFHGTVPDSIGSAHVDCFQTFDDNGEYAQDILIDANWCFDCHQGFMGEGHYYHNTRDITFMNNIFSRCWAWGLCVQDIANVKVYNNTFAFIQYHGTGFQGSYATGCLVRNNIYYNTGTSYWWSDSAQASGDYNLIYQASPPTQPGTHDIIGLDPQFEDPNNYDFRLKETSPAIEQGDSILIVDHDIIGTTRPQNNFWDIGAYEFISSEIRNTKKISSETITIPTIFKGMMRLKGFEDDVFTIFDVAGRFVKETRGDNIGADLEPGIYFLENSNLLTFKVVKIE